MVDGFGVVIADEAGLESDILLRWKAISDIEYLEINGPIRQGHQFLWSIKPGEKKIEENNQFLCKNGHTLSTHRSRCQSYILMDMIESI